MTVKSGFLVLILTTFHFCCTTTTGSTVAPISEFASRQEENAQKSHQLGSLNLVIFVGLLILTVLTIWLFKHRRFRFVHETGLAILYGLIVGAIIRYAGSTSQHNTLVVYGDPSNVSGVPDIIRLNLTVDQGSDSNYTVYRYEYKGETRDEKDLEEKATFDPEIFFNVLLPPIIFNAGYSMKRKHFFKNFGAIMTYAFAGTVTSALTVGAICYGFSRFLPELEMTFTSCLFFGALISATDPVTVLAIFSDLNVDVDLYALVFGESVLNDAVAIVLASTIEHYENNSDGFDGIALLKAVGDFLKIFLGAFALGSAMGCITALITKYTHIRDYPLLETSLFFLMSYGTYVAAEAAAMTGIVAVLFCGICQAHYTFHNLSDESKGRTKELFELLNFLSENFVFTYIGVSTFTYMNHIWNPAFIAAAFLGIFVGRLCNIYPLSFLLNLGRSNKIHYNVQHMMLFSGLRGAIAFALAIRTTDTIQQRSTFSTTLIIVITTVILCGGLTTQMLQWLKIKVGVEEEVTELQRFEAVRTHSQRNYSTMEGADVGASPVDCNSPTEMASPAVQAVNPTRLAEKAVLVRGWYKVDARFVKPLLTHSKPALTETLPKCCLPVAKLLTTEEQYSQTAEEDSDVELVVEDGVLIFNSNGGEEGKENQGENQISTVSQTPNLPVDDNIIEVDITSGPVDSDFLTQ